MPLEMTAVSYAGECGTGYSPALVCEICSLLRESEPFNGACQKLSPPAQDQWDGLAHAQMSQVLAGCMPGCLIAAVLHCLSATKVSVTLFPCRSLRQSVGNFWP